MVVIVDHLLTAASRWLVHRGAFLFGEQPFNGHADHFALGFAQTQGKRLELFRLLWADFYGGHDAVGSQGITSRL